ncbi:nucleoside hydrolase, partial [Bifidobacterium dentium]|uniref:nucleoside hydrolase n=1 Tax=Bifidobacterium dentium TaxID=1689 RepID=UPI002549F757
LWIDAIERGTDDLHLIVTGPMTNLAVFAHQHPAHFARLKHITVMGGAVIYPGNTTPNAEWNFWVDPHAANEVFRVANT